MARGAAPAAFLHLIHGDKDKFDSWIAERSLQRICAQWLGADPPPDAIVTFRGEERATWPEIADALRSGSLFASKRVVVVRRAESVTDDAESLLAALEAPGPGNALIVIAAKTDKRLKLWKALFARANVQPALPLKEGEVRAELRQELAKRQLQLSADTIEKLIARVGQDLRRLMGEVDKLELLADGGRLSAEEAAASLGRAMGRPAWLLGEAVGRRNLAAALSLVEEELDLREYPPLLLGRIYSAIRGLRGARALGLRGLGTEHAPLLGVLPFKVAETVDNAREWTDAQLDSALAGLQEADRRLKLGAEPRATLAAALVAALGGADRTARPGTAGPDRGIGGGAASVRGGSPHGTGRRLHVGVGTRPKS